MAADCLHESKRQSRAIVIAVDDKRVIVYHSLLGQPKLVEFGAIDDAVAFRNLHNSLMIDTGDPSLDDLVNVSDGDARSTIDEASVSYLQQSRSKVNFLSLLTSEACNLGCPYCIAGENMQAAAQKKSVTMSWEVAKAAIDYYFQVVSSGSHPYINFSGGEPLLNWPIILRTLQYVSTSYAQTFPDPITFSINTNATLITLEIAAILRDYRVSVATSLDGTPQSSDLVRIGKATRLGVSDKILGGWQKLADVGHPITGFMATFNDRNIEALNEQVVDFAIQQGCKWLRVDCDVIHLSRYPIKELIDRIWHVYCYGQKHGITVEGFWSTAIHNLVADKARSPITFFCGAVSGETMSVHPDGRISACGFSRGTIGNVFQSEQLDWTAHKDLINQYLPGHREFCVGCSIEGSCAGGCNIAREESVLSGTTAAIDYNCELYRELTRRLLVDYFSSQVPRPNKDEPQLIH